MLEKVVDHEKTCHKGLVESELARPCEEASPGELADTRQLRTEPAVVDNIETAGDIGSYEEDYQLKLVQETARLAVPDRQALGFGGGAVGERAQERSVAGTAAEGRVRSVEGNWEG